MTRATRGLRVDGRTMCGELSASLGRNLVLVSNRGCVGSTLVSDLIGSGISSARLGIRGPGRRPLVRGRLVGTLGDRVRDLRGRGRQLGGRVRQLRCTLVARRREMGRLALPPIEAARIRGGPMRRPVGTRTSGARACARRSRPAPVGERAMGGRAATPIRGGAATTMVRGAGATDRASATRLLGVEGPRPGGQGGFLS